METLDLEIYQFTKSVIGDTTNLEKSVARFFSPRAVQVDCEMKKLNSYLKYGFVICNNYSIKYIIDKNMVVICNLIGKKVTRKFILTP